MGVCGAVGEPGAVQLDGHQRRVDHRHWVLRGRTLLHVCIHYCSHQVDHVQLQQLLLLLGAQHVQHEAEERVHQRRGRDDSQVQRVPERGVQLHDVGQRILGGGVQGGVLLQVLSVHHVLAWPVLRDGRLHPHDRRCVPGVRKL